MGKHMDVIVTIKPSGSSVAPVLMFNPNQMLDKDKLLTRDMAMTKSSTLYYGLTRITGLQ